VADIEDGEARELHRETRITRLGEGVDTRGRLLPVPIARVRNTLSDYRRTAESLGAERTLLIATSAVRDAENGEAFLGEIGWSYGGARGGGWGAGAGGGGGGPRPWSTGGAAGGSWCSSFPGGACRSAPSASPSGRERRSPHSGLRRMRCSRRSNRPRRSASP